MTPAGEVVLTSQYYGSGRLAHQRIRVWEGEQEAFTDTVPLESADVYHGSFLGTTWERVTFRSGREDGMAPFIVAHAGKRLKMAFLGKGSQYVIFLEERDIKAIGEAVELAAALREEKAYDGDLPVTHQVTGRPFVSEDFFDFLGGKATTAWSPLTTMGRCNNPGWAANTLIQSSADNSFPLNSDL